ncbi:MAG: (2Fe-2S)-binding protein [Halanaerobiales bacterium]|nr:(2Fe-2S)-binding protein [Halanaerobiales bacterium]
MKDDVIVCRCEEVTLGEIKEAIEAGARTVTDVKRRTRAGMGLCQGKSCEIIVQRQLCKQLNLSSEEAHPARDRAPVRPISFGVLGDEYND